MTFNLKKNTYSHCLKIIPVSIELFVNVFKKDEDIIIDIFRRLRRLNRLCGHQITPSDMPKTQKKNDILNHTLLIKKKKSQ